MTGIDTKKPSKCSKALIAAVLAIFVTTVSEAKHGGSRSYKANSKPRASQRQEKPTRTKESAPPGQKSLDSPKSPGLGNNVASGLGGAAIGYGISEMLKGKDSDESNNQLDEKGCLCSEKTDLQRSSSSKSLG